MSIGYNKLHLGMHLLFSGVQKTTPPFLLQSLLLKVSIKSQRTWSEIIQDYIHYILFQNMFILSHIDRAISTQTKKKWSGSLKNIPY